MILLHIDEPPAPPAKRLALFDLGFRPFYLAASVFAALSIPLWALQFSGWLAHPYLAGPVWHAHEMVFGFTLAVIVGFLFTAGRNWSNQPTPTGGLLAALAGLWLAGRVLVLTPFATAAALVNVAFPLAAAVALAIPFARSRNRRNHFFVGLLLLLGVAAGLVHASQRGVAGLPAGLPLQAALDVVLFILAVMGGRVIPMFTNNGVYGASARRLPWVERLSLGSVLLLLGADVVGVAGWPLAVPALAAFAVHLVRWLLWQPWRTWQVPLVGVLHLAYAWIPLHLALRAAAGLGLVPASIATHALTVGAVGGLIIGMMTRTAKGHTARPLLADRVDITAYGLVAASAFVRVGLPLASPSQTVNAVLASALLWSAGFALYAVRYAPMLCLPRLDGRPG